MNRVLLLMPVVFALGCTSSAPSTSSTTPVPTTELSGTWNVTGTGKTSTSSATGTFQVKLVSSPCTVATPVGTFTASGSTCFIANNNSGLGAITGASVSSANKNLGQGILIGVAADPVPDNATINMVFVSAYNGGKTFQEFTGTASIVSGKMTGSGSCSTASTALCTGATASFTASHQ
jgi:hypothetical protein